MKEYIKKRVCRDKTEGEGERERKHGVDIDREWNMASRQSGLKRRVTRRERKLIKDQSGLRQRL